MIRQLFAPIARLFSSAPVEVQSAATVAAPTPAAQSQRDADKAMLMRRLGARNWKWRSLARLMVAIKSSDGNYTMDLLQEIGARPSWRNDRVWGLKSRVGVTGRRITRMSSSY